MLKEKEDEEDDDVAKFGWIQFVQEEVDKVKS